MRQARLLGGLGGLAFGILALPAFMIGDPPGGDYSVADVTSFLDKDHRPAVFVSIYLMLVVAVGLLLLLHRLRAAIDDRGRAGIFWGFGIAAVFGWFGGYVLTVSPALALAYSSGHLSTLDPATTYALNEAGESLMFGGGGLMLGCALVTFAAGRVAVPAWVRWTTLVGGLAALAGLAWFPFFLVYLWAIALGVWTLAAARSAEPAAEATPLAG